MGHVVLRKGAQKQATAKAFAVGAGACRSRSGRRVINLALHNDARYSLRDEAATVRELGMRYIHIPVQFKAPSEEDFLLFCAAMDSHAGDKMLVHCAANYRVTAFIGVYRVVRQQWTAEKAFETMRSVW